MPKTANLLFILVIALGAPLPVSGPAQAQNLVSWVSVDGSDTNNCQSPGSACRTVNQALNVTDVGGEIRCGGNGFADFGVVITKPITIDCTGAPGTVLGAGRAYGISVNLAEATYPNGVVILRGLTIDGTRESVLYGSGADGIGFIGGGAALHVEECTIRNFDEQGVDFRPTSSADLFIRDTVIGDNTGGGVYVVPAVAAAVKGSLSRVSLDRNGALGLYVSKTGGALAAITVDDSNIENGSFGLRANGAKASILLNASTIAHNTTGLQVLSGGNILSFGNNSIGLNTTNGAPTGSLGVQ